MQNTIPVRFGPAGSPVNPMVYGQFIEHLLNCIDGGIYDPDSQFADAAGTRTDVLEKAEALQPPILRFPGGTVMCLYHWEDAIGPLETRRRRRNIIWGGEIDPGFGTAEFVAYCRRLGAEPMICVNMASGTPEEAGSWVEYCNGTGNSHYAALRRAHGYPEPFNVKYWCIGNECYAEPDIGIQNDVQVYIRDAREFIKFMKLNDPAIKTVLVGCDDMAWNRAVLDALHPMADYLSYHHYSAEAGRGLYGPFAGEKQLVSALGALSGLLAEYPETVTDFSPWYRFPPRSGRLRLALDEWNIWNSNSSETYGLDAVYTWRDAVWVASALNDILACEAVEIANMAQMVNVIAPILADPAGAYYQTIAYPLLHYRRMMLGSRVPVEYTPPVLDTPAGRIDALNLCALRQADGSLHLAAVNRDFENACTLDLGFAGTVAVTRLSAPPHASCSAAQSCVLEESVAASGNAVPLTPGSVSLIRIPAQPE